MKSKYFMRGMGFGIAVTSILFASAMVFYQPKMSDEAIRKEAKKLGMVEESEASDKDSLALTEDEAEKIQQDVEEKAKAAKTGEEKNAQKKEEANALASETREESKNEKEEAENNRTEAEEKKAEAEGKKDEANEVQSAAKKEEDAIKQAINDQNKKVRETSASDVHSAAREEDTNNSGSNGQRASGTEESTGSGTEESTASTTNNREASGAPVEFIVKSGENSSVVGANLYKAGLVDNPTQFDRYLEQHNYDNHIQNGTFSIKKGSTYEEIAKILTRN